MSCGGRKSNAEPAVSGNRKFTGPTGKQEIQICLCGVATQLNRGTGGIDFANNCDDPLVLMSLKEELVRLSKENEILKNNSSNTNTSKKEKI